MHPRAHDHTVHTCTQLHVHTHAPCTYTHTGKTRAHIATSTWMYTHADTHTHTQAHTQASTHTPLLSLPRHPQG